MENMYEIFDVQGKLRDTSIRLQSAYKAYLDIPFSVVHASSTKSGKKWLFSGEDFMTYADTDLDDWERIQFKKYIAELDKNNSKELGLPEEELTSSEELSNYMVKLKPKTTVDNNPKTQVALSKPRLSDVPPVSLFALGAAMSDGAAKYGRFNWRDTSVTASVFYDAMMRHLTDWYNGEEHAHDSKVSHLGHIMASCAILLDSKAEGVFIDDRKPSEQLNVSRSSHLWID
jgi:hypothetical protein